MAKVKLPVKPVAVMRAGVVAPGCVEASVNVAPLALTKLPPPPERRLPLPDQANWPWLVMVCALKSWLEVPLVDRVAPLALTS